VTRAILAISALAVIAFAIMIGPPEQRARLYPVMAINDIVAFRRAVLHGAAVERNTQVERDCAPIRQARYATLDRLFVHYRILPGPAFSNQYLGEPIAEEDDRSVVSYPILDVNPPHEIAYQIQASGNLGHVDELRAIVATHSEDGCRASDDEAIECPATCHEDALEACNALHARLNRTWRHEPTAIWKSADDDVRASLVIEESSCELVFERNVAMSRWISLAAGAEIPIGLLGRPVGWIPRRPYSYPLARTGDTLEWQAAATGEHVRGMRVALTVKHGIIVDVRAAGMQSDIAADEIAALTRDLPVKIETDDIGQLVIVADASRLPGADR
jgi:hypothetical protein